MLPQGFPERMLHLLGEAEFAEFLASYERPRSAGLRLNPRKPLPEGVTLPFCEAQVPWEPNGYYVCEGSRPGLHPWHDAGAYYLQEPSAMAPARLLDAQPGERVLDLCAAPGGKTTQLAAAMQGRGLLVCNEIHPRRAQVLASNIERLGIPEEEYRVPLIVYGDYWFAGKKAIYLSLKSRIQEHPDLQTSILEEITQGD